MHAVSATTAHLACDNSQPAGFLVGWVVILLKHRNSSPHRLRSLCAHLLSKRLEHGRQHSANLPSEIRTERQVLEPLTFPHISHSALLPFKGYQPSHMMRTYTLYVYVEISTHSPNPSISSSRLQHCSHACWGGGSSPGHCTPIESLCSTIGRPQRVPELQPWPGTWTGADGPPRRQRRRLLQAALTAPPPRRQQPHTHRHRQTADVAHPRAPPPATLRPDGCPVLGRNSPAQRNQPPVLRSVSRAFWECPSDVRALSHQSLRTSVSLRLHVLHVLQRNVHCVEAVLPLWSYPYRGGGLGLHVVLCLCGVPELSARGSDVNTSLAGFRENRQQMCRARRGSPAERRGPQACRSRQHM